MLTLDLTTFDDFKIFNKTFKTLKGLDNYIKKLSGIKDFSIHQSSDQDLTKQTIERNYFGDVRYFSGDEGFAQYKTYAMLRTYITKYNGKYGVSSFDYGYLCANGWREIQNRYNINIIESDKSHKVHWRTN